MTRNEKRHKLEAQINKLEAKHAELVNKASIHSKSARTISCSVCQKKFVRAEINGETCPDCDCDFRSFPMREKISYITERIVAAKKELAVLSES